MDFSALSHYLALSADRFQPLRLLPPLLFSVYSGSHYNTYDWLPFIFSMRDPIAAWSKSRRVSHEGFTVTTG